MHYSYYELSSDLSHMNMFSKNLFSVKGSSLCRWFLFNSNSCLKPTASYQLCLSFPQKRTISEPCEKGLQHVIQIIDTLRKKIFGYRLLMASFRQLGDHSSALSQGFRNSFQRGSRWFHETTDPRSIRTRSNYIRTE